MAYERLVVGSSLKSLFPSQMYPSLASVQGPPAKALTAADATKGLGALGIQHGDMILLSCVRSGRPQQHSCVVCSEAAAAGTKER